MALEYPEGLLYLDTHEYLKIEDGVMTIGITAFAIDQLGDIVFLELPDVGDSVDKGERFGSVESVKAVEDIYAPTAGTVVERNEPLLEAPETLGDDPYGDGWLIKVRIDDGEEPEETMSAQEYQELVEGSDD